jgi:hypothetical protein
MHRCHGGGGGTKNKTKQKNQSGVTPRYFILFVTIEKDLTLEQHEGEVMK